ncbi:MAG: tRNA preQ1(34) S-adenosylmethionine ribosyltransferase-isomerase QueA [Gammaproteobacteria bacterium]
MRPSDFHFDLPAELIAQQPVEPRDASRMLCLDRVSGALVDRRFRDIGDYLRPDDLLVFNDTRVIPARLFGHKDSGGRVEILIERVLTESHCLAQIRASKSPGAGTRIDIQATDTSVTVTGRRGQFYELETRAGQTVQALLEEAGHIPLPPYITRPDTPTDRARYQTVYARHPGAVAAPTAGLHFTAELLRDIEANRCRATYITLHVGAGTFQPVRVEDIRSHKMHSEWFAISDAAAFAIRAAKAAGGRVIAVGTTSLRSLEAAADADGQVQAVQGETDIFIYPGYRFKAVDALITNFHLPESTLLMLVAAFAGKDRIMRAYDHAIAERYRFFSYGDAMFIH